jgi:hypothetical protein
MKWRKLSWVEYEERIGDMKHTYIVVSGNLREDGHRDSCDRTLKWIQCTWTVRR